ncbi:hypothetical protein RUM44_013137 [Polyplax serrata]|uniref:Small VCP/p97-interacting protein n=1 Tax=Polyplax serrata TaxID=468196 RepID=A0ABR1BDB9_POLSC
MGALFSCCRSTSSEVEYLTPNLETKRRQQAEAAERRLREQECRGIKDPERLKQKAKRVEELEKRHEEVSKAIANGGPTLTWTVG